MNNYDEAEEGLRQAWEAEDASAAASSIAEAQVYATLALVDAIRDITKVTVTQHDVHTDLTCDLMGLARDGAQDIIGRRLADLMHDDLEPMARHD